MLPASRASGERSQGTSLEAALEPSQGMPSPAPLPSIEDGQTTSSLLKYILKMSYKSGLIVTLHSAISHFSFLWFMQLSFPVGSLINNKALRLFHIKGWLRTSQFPVPGNIFDYDYWPALNAVVSRNIPPSSLPGVSSEETSSCGVVCLRRMTFLILVVQRRLLLIIELYSSSIFLSSVIAGSWLFL